ncbi:MAG: hypothetical protein AAGH40_10450 [Verrucomicrobiota bacterium]
MMKIRFVILFLSSFFVAFANDPVEVDRVDFNRTREKWIQMEIQISCNGNPAPDARDKRFLEDIQVTAYLGYAIDPAARKFDFYKAESRIVIMEENKDVNVYFYLPGMIVDRDRLDNDSEYYFVELAVKGQDLPPQPKSFGQGINEASYNSMKELADSSDETKHILMPYYLAPPEFRGSVSDLPIYLRPDVEVE